jgi:hypothetical protein
MFPCHRYTALPHSRREFLRQAGCGFGAVALSALWATGEILSREIRVWVDWEHVLYNVRGFAFINEWGLKCRVH